MGPVIAALVLWALRISMPTALLAGFIYALALILFVLAAATDWLDGYLARKLERGDAVGRGARSRADKVLITCVLVALAYAALPLDLVAAAVIILGRDVAVAGLREGISAQGKTLPVSQLGKWKAAAEMAGVGAFLAFQTAALCQRPLASSSGWIGPRGSCFGRRRALALISGGAICRRGDEARRQLSPGGRTR